ncbi:type I 3-dehydroquinate dehydratase [Haladaptatus sp. GCM10025707]|uniref:type I 3-dehydroquinate dehydratase n=1 Tax=unclassified Haladaptatus TaxID=2622732 RepID=UPI0023E7D6D2|nr:type I 3-dehydroquinate dehydratase [Haladaptatus sp. QDMS2]
MDFDEFVLAASTAVLDDEPDARPHADAVEFRMDLAADPLAALRNYGGTLPIIATNRVNWEGGQAEDDATRLDTLCAAAAETAVEAVDIELAAILNGDGARVVDAARESDTKVIVSVHDFEETPRIAELRHLLKEATDHGDVGKLACTATSVDDVLDLLFATRTFSMNGRPVATMAMGKLGRHSRVVAPLYGSCLGFAPIRPEDATAPGQYDLGTLRQLLTQLQGDG